MPLKSEPPPRPSTRFSYERITEEIELWLQSQPRGAYKRLAMAAGVEPDGFSHRMSGRYRFSLEQLGAIGDEVDEAPDYWPVVPWQALHKEKK